MAGQGNLILGMASGYAAKDLRPFVQSLAMTGFRGRLVLFVYSGQRTSIRDMVNACAPALDLDLVVIDGIRKYAKLWRSCFKRLFELMPAESFPGLKRRMLRFQGMPHVTRYFHYQDYLARHDGYTHVLLSDVRDVVFQDDPFRDLGTGLHVGMETDTLTIATEPFDRDWIMDAYGEAMLQRIGGCQISCSGVTLGDAASVKTYVAQILEEAMSFPFKKMKTRIYDQAFHNKLLHCSQLGPTRLCQPLQSMIATVGCLTESQFSLSADGRLLNEDGQAAPIVHQYDRHPLLVHAFEARILV
ncbi:hypothetical protein DVT68_10865 [Dyella solisilvae]|uniref:Uncharacterized protein n=1 Tax=Dyella solisilvae TaxID=1920168 RepID=A0A370K964_9GAMM|nr:hypothetical protein [Dyella solisilvae]RDI98987.1 hypothetical protein DVT68_10865 [Dyella solisilvae]